MKKILAILMTLVMLLSACAFAETNKGAEIILSDLVAFAGETPILDLTGLSMGVGVSSGAAGNGLQLTLGAAGNEVLALNVGISDGQLLLGMTGVTGVYSLDLSTVAESAGVDMDAVAGLDVEQVTQAIRPEDQAALMALLMEGVALVQAGTTVGAPEEIDGVTYEVTTVEVAEDSVRPLLEKAAAILDNYAYLLEDSGFESFTQLYNELTPAIGVSGVILNSEESGVVDFTLTGSVLNGEQSGFVMLYLEGEEAENGTALYVETYIGAGEEYYGAAFNLDFIDENDGSWIPASDAPVDLLAAIEDEAQSQQLMLQAMSSAMMALSQMAAANETVAALMGSLMGA